MQKRVRSPFRRLAAGFAGFFLLGAGAVLSLPMVPGPGLLVVALALAILAAEFLWARRLMRGICSQVERTRVHPAIRSMPILQRGLGVLVNVLKRRSTVSWKKVLG